MPIEFSCSQCGKQLRTPDETAGRNAKCPQCGTVMQIPHPAAFAPFPSEAAPLGSPSTQQTGSDSFNFNPYESPQASSPYRRGEVETGAPLASLGARFAGALLDGLFSLLAATPGFILLIMAIIASPIELPDGAGTVELFQLFPGPSSIAYGGALVLAIVNWVMITQSGQSLGKKIVGTRIVRLDGSLPGFGYGVALRSWVPSVIQSIPLIGPLFWLVDALFIFGSQRRCIHDQMAGTRVVQA